MARPVLPLLATTLVVAAPSTRTPAPEAAVQRQLEATNAHDLQAFLACFAEDAEVHDLPGGVRSAGRAGLAQAYGTLFKAHPDLHVRATDQILSGGYVIRRERVTGYADRRAAREGVVVYQVKEGLIRRVWVLEPEGGR